MNTCFKCAVYTVTHLQADGETELCVDCCGCNEQ